jgi:hypothetical protein
MPIVFTRSERSRQANGSFHVVERHLDDAGVEHTRTWFADSKMDIDARVATHAAELEQDIERQVAAEKERTDAREMEEKLIAYALAQPAETLKVGVKLTDDEIAVLQKREATVKVIDAGVITRG